MSALGLRGRSEREAGGRRPGGNAPETSIRIARTMADMMHVVSIRSSVYMAEQDCPYDEEFDGNDLCGAHLIASLDGEPIACLRARFFADFAKLERLAVRAQYRKSTVAFELVRAGIELCRRKGYRRIYGHAQDRLVPFWKRFGARPLPRSRPLSFSDFSYTEMLLETEVHPSAVTLETDPYVIIRPEGEWDLPGVLDRSSVRGVTSPLHDVRAA
ncbi:GNAT family N-acetyltransferase [Alsobacter soli]|uniref:GNAT family N-acetyltransferase n=1 Tax=Alsobacter soli TaxID=2109933 RepID=A0A2T1HRR9_9HYPH|nr:GNAT family N-acetyltransferase [Alsobacter soli]